MKIHFIGIGGIGISSLARYFFAKGHQVRGSDINDSELIQSLKKEGIEVIIGPHTTKNIQKNIDLVIHTPAVSSNNPEMKKAKKERIKVLSYPETLGELTKDHFTITVSGTHGKSTTTAMLALVLVEAGLDPTVIIGTKLKEFNGSNFRIGKSKYLLIEADEYKESFLNYHPRIIAITNIDKDHLDHYGNLDNIIKAFRTYFKRLCRGGKIVANGDDLNTVEILKENKKAIFYSINQKEAVAIRQLLKVPGSHNVSNALTAYKVANLLGIDKDKILNSLSKYRGAWRRFEIFKTGYKKILLVSDYAHHPTEIEKTLEAAREKYPKKRILCVFQPHQYKRTQYLFDDFIKALKNAPVNKIILSEIYEVTGREESKITENVSSRKMAKAVGKRVIYKKAIKDIELYLKRNAREGDVIIIMGAGNIYDLFLKMKSYFLDKKKK